MRISVEQTAGMFVLPVMLFLPVIIYSIGGASSYAVGVIVASSIITLLSIRFLNSIAQYAFSIAFLLIFIASHSIVAVLLFEPDEVSKTIISLCGMLVTLFTMPLIFRRIELTSDANANRIVSIMIMSLLVFAAAGLLGWNIIPGEALRKTAGIFPEPSHLAVTLSPLLLHTVIYRGTVYATMISFAFLLWALLYGSLVGMAVICVAILMGVKWNVWYIISIPLTAIISWKLVDIDYILPRLQIMSLEDGNISTWAFVRGWEDAFDHLQASNWFGVGFQQFGSVPSTGYAHFLLHSNSLEHLNSLDGGSTAPKIIGEFGIIGVIVVILLMVASIRSLVILRTRRIKLGTSIILASTATMPIELFLRGAGYFTPTFIISVMGVFLISEGYGLLGNHPKN